MIRNVTHRGLKRFWQKGDGRKLPAPYLVKIRAALTTLEAAERPEDADLPGFRLHQLSGDMAGRWSMAISANWRITFAMDGTDVIDVDFEDYH